MGQGNNESSARNFVVLCCRLFTYGHSLHATRGTPVNGGCLAWARLWTSNGPMWPQRFRHDIEPRPVHPNLYCIRIKKDVGCSAEMACHRIAGYLTTLWEAVRRP